MIEYINLDEDINGLACQNVNFKNKTVKLTNKQRKLANKLVNFTNKSYYLANKSTNPANKRMEFANKITLCFNEPSAIIDKDS